MKGKREHRAEAPFTPKWLGSRVDRSLGRTAPLRYEGRQLRPTEEWSNTGQSNQPERDFPLEAHIPRTHDLPRAGLNFCLYMRRAIADKYDGSPPRVRAVPSSALEGLASVFFLLIFAYNSVHQLPW